MPEQVVTIETLKGSHEITIDGHFTTIAKYLNAAKEGKANGEPGQDGILPGHFATIESREGRLVLNPDHVVSVRENK